MRPWQPRPLITFALFSYNQERFVRAAVRGALLQTYSPLEIICSDDASSDLTADVVRDELTSYSGEHTIHFNVNATNLGIADHLSHVLNKARGELVVVAAGDDVSFPERTEMLFQAWSREGRKVMSLFSGYELIDVSGRVLRTV